MANKLVDGECFLSGDCQRANLIYKLFCGCCGDFYIGKTQNYVKKRTQTHINHVVKMWKIKQNYLKSLELTDGSSIFSPPTTGSNRSMTTRAMGRAARTSSPDPGTPDDPNAGIIALAALFTSPILTNELPDDNSEVEEAEYESPEQDDFIQADHDVIDNIIHATEGLLPPSPGNSVNSASTRQSSTNLFRQEFGTPAGHPTTQEAIQHLVQARTQLYRPILDSELKAVHCSSLSRHLWSHCQDMDFSCKEEVSAWCRKTLKLEIISSGSAISLMKSAGTKSCKLCMSERIALFRHFSKKKTKEGNLMNSRKEMHSKCTCETRFIRLRSVENESADEAE